MLIITMLAHTGGSGTLVIVSLFWIVWFSCSVNSIVVTAPSQLQSYEVTTIQLTLHENPTIQNKHTTRSVQDPPVRAGDEKHTSSAARWVWVRDNNESLHSIHSTDDSAGFDGSFIYGELLDKSKLFAPVQQELYLWTDQWNLWWIIIMERHIFNIQRRSNSTTKEISSEVYVLCFCESKYKYTCSKQKSIIVHKDQEFSVSLLALSQGDHATSTLVTSILNPTARLGLDQSVQAVHEVCTELKFNLYSTREGACDITNSSCRDAGLASAVVNVNFLSYTADS